MTLTIPASNITLGIGFDIKIKKEDRKKEKTIYIVIMAICKGFMSLWQLYISIYQILSSATKQMNINKTKTYYNVSQFEESRDPDTLQS